MRWKPPTQSIASQSLTLDHGVPYVFKLRVVASSGGAPVYSMKVWEQGTPEPGLWTLSGSGIVGEPPNGSLLLVAHHTDATFGDVVIRKITDETPPVLTNVQATPTASAISVTADTDEPSKLTVLYGLTNQYELGSVTTASLETAHQLLLGSLDPDTDYYLRVLATDAAGNQSATQDLVVRTDVADVTAPVVSNLTLLTLSEQIRVQADTDELATLDVSYGLTSGYELGTVTGGLAVSGHEVMVTGLQPNTTYHLRVVATDTSGNVSPEQTFVVTTPAPDVDPPVVQSVQPTAGVTTIDLAVLLSEHAQVEVTYGLTTSYELGAVQGPPLETNHNVTLTGLTADTSYYVRVVATDPSGNVSAPYDLVVTTDVLRVPTSDHFNGPLDVNLWTLVDPLGDAILTSNGNNVLLGVPGGTEHNMWSSGINAARLMQTISDVDFEVEVGFAAPPSGSIAMNGVFVDAGAGALLRFDFYSSGSNIKVFAASFVAGQPTVRNDATISAQPNQPLLMRVRREGNVWTQSYSSDGQTWTTAVQFAHQAVVQGVGVSSGNAGSLPAHTAVVDYFHNTASPAADTQPPVIESVTVAEQLTSLILDVAVDEPTTVEVFYGETSGYELGSVSVVDPAVLHEVTIPGLQQGTTYFLRVAVTDAAGLTSLQDLTATTAVPDLTPPTVSTVIATPSYQDLQLSFTTDEPATTEVIYGLTPTYELGSVQSLSLETNHSVTINGLVASTTYYVRVLATDASGNVSAPQDLTVTTEALLLPTSDHFNGPLDTNLWTLVDPLGDATLESTGNHVRLGVPSGVEHNLWTNGVNAPRLMQTVSDVDFRGRSRIPGSAVRVDRDERRVCRYRCRGLRPFRLLQQRESSVKIFSASFVAGQPTSHVNSTITAQPGQPLMMRVRREGDVWTQSYSTDGQAWTTAVQFSHQATVQGVGVSSGNAGSLPAHTAVVDYFFNTSTPVADTAAPVISGLNATAGATSFTVTGATDENAVWQVQYGLTTSYELGTIVEPTPSLSHSVDVSGLQTGTTYYVRVVAVDSLGNASAPTDLEVTTDAVAGPVAVSDEFNGASLDTDVWTFVDPTGDGSVDVSGGTANISVAGGSDHNIWSNGINAPRLMQSAADEDFSAEVKFDNLPTGAYATTGIIVEGAGGTFLRLEFYSDGSSIHLFAGIIQGGSASTLYNQTITASGSSLYMRVTRTGDSWLQEYSTDGANWLSGASFVAAFQVIGIGFYAGNAGGSSAPENTTSVDYFRMV